MATVTISGSQEQLLRLARIITEAAHESKDKASITLTFDNAVSGTIASVQSSGGGSIRKC